MKKKTNYQITIGYRAVICVNVKANNEDQAKEIALEEFKDKFCHGGSNKIEIQGNRYRVDGIVDMDATWNMYDK